MWTTLLLTFILFETTIIVLAYVQMTHSAAHMAGMVHTARAARASLGGDPVSPMGQERTSPTAGFGDTANRLDMTLSAMAKFKAPGEGGSPMMMSGEMTPGGSMVNPLAESLRELSTPLSDSPAVDDSPMQSDVPAVVGAALSLGAGAAVGVAGVDTRFRNSSISGSDDTADGDGGSGNHDSAKGKGKGKDRKKQDKGKGKGKGKGKTSRSLPSPVSEMME